MNTTTEKPTPAEQAAIDNADRRLRRATERLDESTRMLARAIDDADLRNERMSAERLRSLEETVAEDGLLVAKIESELDAAKAAPAIRVERDKRGNELLAAAQAVDSEIASAIAVLESALERGEKIAHQIVTEFADPNFEYHTLTGIFRRSTSVIRLRFWRDAIRTEKIAEYRRLDSPQLSQPVPTPRKVTGVRRILSRAELHARDAAMRSRSALKPGVGVVVESGR